MKGTMMRASLIACTALLVMSAESVAQEAFPTKELSLLVGFPPGGVSDITARVIASAASEQLRQPVIVVNKPGAAGTVSIDFVGRSKPDGYTLVQIGASTLAYTMHTQGVNWKPSDFSVILGHSNYNFAVVVRADAPWKNFEEWVEYVRKNPGFKYGTFGALSTMHIMMEWIAKRLDLKMTPVHFAGDAPGITNLLGGHIEAHLTSGGHAAQVKAGKLRTLLQVTGEPVDLNPEGVTQLRKFLPDAPMEVVDLPSGIFGPKGIPAPIQKELNIAFRKATVDNPEFVKTLDTMRMKVEYHDPEEMQKTMNKAYEDVGRLMKELGLQRK